jgi:hypothetical protein
LAVCEEYPVAEDFGPPLIFTLIMTRKGQNINLMMALSKKENLKNRRR